MIVDYQIQKPLFFEILEMESSIWKDYEDRYKHLLNERKIEFRKHAPKRLTKANKHTDEVTENGEA
jgi:hypothetical protein